jgi:molybdopterin-guanine dinucleotide biosynthesis protein A
MGREKATLAAAGSPLALRAARAAATVADPVVLVAPVGHPAWSLGWPVLADPGEGPLPALAAALSALDAEHVLVLAADHPELQPALLALLAAERSAAAAVACRRAGHLEPLIAVVERAPALAAARRRLRAGDRSVAGLLRTLGVAELDEARWRPADPEGRSFHDLDARADLDAWEDAWVVACGRRGDDANPPDPPEVADGHGRDAQPGPVAARPRRAQRGRRRG